MKTLTFSLLTAVLILGPATHLHSQAPVAPKTVLEQLRDIRQKNKEQLEKQAAAMQKLDALQQDAAQIKFLGKRT